MIIRVTEYTGEVDKIRKVLNYDMRLDVGSPDPSKQFDKEREKAILKRLKMIEKIKKEVSKNYDLNYC